MKLPEFKLLYKTIRWQYGKKTNFKMGVSRKQSTPNFLKNDYFLPPDMHTYIRVRIRV